MSAGGNSGRRAAIEAKVVCFGYDAAAAVVAMYAAPQIIYFFSGRGSPDWLDVFAALVFGVTAGFSLWLRGVHRQVWRHTALRDVVRIFQAVLLANLMSLPILVLASALQGYPLAAIYLQMPIWLVLMMVVRLWARGRATGDLTAIFRGEPPHAPRALVVGPDMSVADALRASRKAPSGSPIRAIGIVETTGLDVGREIEGVQVIGGLNQLASLFDHYTARYGEMPWIAIAAPREDRRTMEAALAVASARKATLLRMASNQNALLEQIRPADLLARPERRLDMAPVAELISGARVFITGGGGTIGGELARQCAALGPSELTVYDSSEFNVFEIDQELLRAYPNVVRRMVIGDVRDEVRLEQAMREAEPDVVIHAAALKHVPLMELNPNEAILTNVLGARRAATIAAELGVKAFTFISTDKAVNPQNVMGATKRAAELFIQAFAPTAPGTRFSLVRFGNVLGSKGSVAPLFERQIAEGGPVTVTHPDMTRFFMSVEEASALVLQAAALSTQSEAAEASLYVLDMGEPVRIFDLAEKMIRMKGKTPGQDILIRVTGPRPGEKLTETVFYEKEQVQETNIDGVLEVARTKSPPISEVQARLDAVIAYAARRDPQASLSMMQALAPELFDDDPWGEAALTIQ
ncbi:MAG: NAD-dependent epimerase/dehydratase family protein [Alphaproteobacteria bacterium]|nr:NAD-dependent epimerase/dehydratase family protein [Alphaproteobacteria bacterium]